MLQRCRLTGVNY